MPLKIIRNDITKVKADLRYFLQEMAVPKMK